MIELHCANNSIEVFPPCLYNNVVPANIATLSSIKDWTPWLYGGHKIIVYHKRFHVNVLLLFSLTVSEKRLHFAQLGLKVNNNRIVLLTASICNPSPNTNEQTHYNLVSEQKVDHSWAFLRQTWLFGGILSNTSAFIVWSLNPYPSG